MSAKRYGQFCALARALDRVGDRWTLLIVRELLLSPKRYGEMHASLPGIATNLLADRLQELCADGLVERRPELDGRYRLTELGEGLEPAVLALIRWGAAWMVDGPGGDRVDPRWAGLALRALLEGPVSGAPVGEAELRVGADERLVVAVSRGVRRVQPGRSRRPRATVRASLPTVLAAAVGVRALPARAVDGDQAFARAVLDANLNALDRWRTPPERGSR